LRKTAKERGMSAQLIEKERDENCTKGAKSEKEGWFGMEKRLEG